MSPGRSVYRDRCETCASYRPLCICAIAPKFKLRTRVVVIMHHREIPLTSNTSQLARLTLENFDLKIRGLKDSPADLAGVIPPESQPLLLFPTEQSVELSPEYLKSFDRPITLIVPDGSWRQARKVSFREPELRGVPHIRLPLGAKTEYRLRRGKREDGLCTFEAIARALGMIENAEVQRELEKIFKIKVERTLWSRGELPPEQCLGGIPDEAYLQAYLAGAMGGKKPKRDRFS